MSSEFHSVRYAVNGVIQPKPLRKAPFLEALKKEELTFNSQLQGKFAVQQSEQSYMYRVLSYDQCYDSFRRAIPQFHHEMLHGPCRMFFDLDMKLPEGVEKNDAGAILLSEFFRLVHEKLNEDGLDIMELRRQFAIMQRPRVRGAINYEKLSFRIVRNDDRHFRSPRHLGAYLKARLSVDDFRSLGIDDKYREGNLQPIGGCKWAEWHDNENKNLYQSINANAPFFLPIDCVDARDSTIAFPQFLRGFANYIPPTSILVEENASQFGSQPIDEAVDVLANFKGNRKMIDDAVAILARMNGNEDAKVARILFETPEKVEVELEFCRFCSHSRPGSPPNIANPKVVIHVIEQVAEVRCWCPPPQKPHIFGITMYGEMCYGFYKDSLPQICQREDDRPDFPITSDDLGCRGLDFDWHEKRGYKDFAFHPPPRSTGHIYSSAILRMIKGESLIPGAGAGRCNVPLLISYANLFFAEADELKKFYCRTPTGYTVDTTSHTKDVKMAQFNYLWEEENGRDKDGNTKYKEVKKKFFQEWLTGGHRVFAKKRYMGPFDLDNPAFKDRLQYLCPAATNYTRCLLEWNGLRPDDCLRNMLEALWDRYLMIVTGNEKAENAQVCREWIERWMLTTMFKPGEKLYANLWIVSPEHGTGKSTLFEIMCKNMGSGLSMVENSMISFLEKKFNLNANVPLVVFDDAIPEKMSTEHSNAFKNLVTCQTSKSDEKNGANNIQSANISNYAMPVNPNTSGRYIPGIATEKERRNAAFEILSSMQQDIYLSNDGRYECECGGDEVCHAHSFSDSARFWMLFREHILGHSPETKGDLFELFTGMLFSIYREKSARPAGVWLQSVQQTLPVCDAIVKHQRMSATPLEQWYDDCVARKYSICPFGGAEAIFLNEGKIKWPEGLRLDVDGDPTWIEWVPVSSLFRAFKLESSGLIGEATFISELNRISMSRQSKALEEKMIACKTYEFKKDATTFPPENRWIPVTKGDTKCRCIRLLSMKRIERGTFVQQAAAAMQHVDFRLDLAISRSGNSRGPLLRSSSMNAIASQPLSLESSQSSREKRSRSVRDDDDNEGLSLQGAVEMARRMDDAFSLRQTVEVDLMDEGDDEDDEEQDALAAWEDFQADSRKRSRFIDNEAGEADEDEVIVSPANSSPEIGFSLSE